MNKRLVSRLMHEQVNGLRSSGVYFFRGDFEYILQGVVLEYVPRGLYIWNFRFPLFDFFGPNLSYSNRLPERAFIGKGEMSEAAIVEHVMDAVEVRDAFGAGVSMSVVEFVQFLELGHLRSPHARLIYAAALVLLGQDARAAELLDELPLVLHPKDVPHCTQLRETLRQGHEVARVLLDQVRQENLQALGVRGG